MPNRKTFQLKIQTVTVDERSTAVSETLVYETRKLIRWVADFRPPRNREEENEINRLDYMMDEAVDGLNTAANEIERLLVENKLLRAVTDALVDPLEGPFRGDRRERMYGVGWTQVNDALDKLASISAPTETLTEAEKIAAELDHINDRLKELRSNLWELDKEGVYDPNNPTYAMIDAALIRIANQFIGH